MTDALRQYLTAQLGGNADAPAEDNDFWQDPLVVKTIDALETGIETLRQHWQRPPSEAVPEPVVSGIEPFGISTQLPDHEAVAPLSDPAILADDHQPEPTMTDGPASLPIDPNPVMSAPEIVSLADPTPVAMPKFGADQPAPPVPAPARAIVLPNATVGKRYGYVVDLAALGLPETDAHSVEGLTDPGLTYDPTTRQLTGTPTLDGEFTFSLTYPKTEEPNRPALTRTMQLLVNADPRSLWKDLPSDTTDPYFKPDEAADFQRVGDVRLVAASVRGRSHAHEGIFRDDDFSLAQIAETGWFLLTVADGAGSAKFSRRGAQLACQTLTLTVQGIAATDAWTAFEAAIDSISDKKTTDNEPVTLSKSAHDSLYTVLGKGVFAAYKAIEAEATANNATSRDYATTLLTTLAKPHAGGWLVGAFMVGDGGIGIHRAGLSPVLLGTPDGGEYAGQTRFLTMSDTFGETLYSRFRFVWVPDMTALVLMTDGVTDPKFQTDANLPRAESWADLWADLTTSVDFADDQTAPARLQAWLNFWSPGNHDDRTIALLYDYV